MTRTEDGGRSAVGPGGGGLGECPPGHDPARYSPMLEERVAAMRAHLTTMRPQSDAEALQTLRRAFPGASLADRVAAIAGRGGHP
jgi:hypothetical protein